MKGQRFVESARMFLTGGRGGDGCSSFRREKYVPRGGPNGGDGGDGGCVILRSDSNIDSLLDVSYRPHRKAGNGGHGKGNNRHGRDREDLVLKVPCGTEIRDDSSNALLADLVEDGAELIVARGGKGGQGNGSWKKGSRRALEECTPGEQGEQKTVRLELKIVADVGLVGLPNAGKSSLLSAISRAHPKIAPYPFTTLHPILGAVRDENFADFAVVDIPGLVKDAHRGAGLGHQFLRHVERARVLAIVIDMAGSDGRNPTDDYFVLLNELSMHDMELAKRPSIVAANKMDIPDAQEYFAEFVRLTGRTPLPVSAATREGVEEFKQAICNAAGKTRSLDFDGKQRNGEGG